MTFTASSTVDPETDQNFTADEIRGLPEDPGQYLWGYEGRPGHAHSLTMEEFVRQYIFPWTILRPPRWGWTRWCSSGNALENVAQAYPGCRFVDLCYPERDPDLGGLDWCSLKLVFAPLEGQWWLVGLIHSQWTI